MRITSDIFDVVQWHANRVGMMLWLFEGAEQSNDNLPATLIRPKRKTGKRFYDLTGRDALEKALTDLHRHQIALHDAGREAAAEWLADAIAGLLADLQELDNAEAQA